MKKDWFELCFEYKTQHEYVVKVHDEETKNHKELDQPLNSAVIPENKEDWL